VRPNSQLYSCAQSRDQAAIIYALARKMVQLDPRLTAAIKIQETAKALGCPELGTYYRALSAEATTAHGLSPQFVVHDELGRVRGPRSPLYEAMETATAAVEAPLSVVISTQAASDEDLLSILLDDALAGHDPHTVVRLYAAPLEGDPFAEATIRLANPGFDFFTSKGEVLAMAADASRMSGSQASFKNLVLNQRIDVAEGAQFVTREVWLANGAKPRDLRFCRVYGGLDMSSVGDVTVLALAGLDPVEADWSVKIHAWLPRKGLDERAAADRQLYRRWIDEGLLELVLVDRLIPRSSPSGSSRSSPNTPIFSGSLTIAGERRLSCVGSRTPCRRTRSAGNLSPTGRGSKTWRHPSRRSGACCLTASFATAATWCSTRTSPTRSSSATTPAIGNLAKNARGVGSIQSLRWRWRLDALRRKGCRRSMFGR
jgi:Phage Terminase